MFRNEILNSIDVIESDSIYTESCVLNEVYKLNEKIDTIESFTQESVFDNDSIISKFIAVIKGFFRAIRLWVDRVLSKITGKLRRLLLNHSEILFSRIKETMIL